VTSSPASKLSRLIVGIDGSGASRVAVEWAAAVAGQVGSEVIVVHAVGLTERYQQRPEKSADWRAHLEDLVRRDWSAPLAERGVTFSVRVVEGNPVVAIVGVATEVAADLVAVGSRGIGGFSGLPLGSTSQQLAMYSPVPVVIVPSDSSRGDSVSSM